ncbi:hypothetical protein ACNQGP_02505 [Flavobacterium sp. GT2N3]|uniref:hypothetical protein n=1 Tax=unclassified Flavobacterium TaxID=196869 RepID=UPI003AB058D4
MVYHLWKKNEIYDSTYKENIQEKEQELSSLLVYEKGACLEIEVKISPKQVEAKQGKRPVKNHSTLPLC